MAKRIGTAFLLVVAGLPFFAAPARGQIPRYVVIGDGLTADSSFGTPKAAWWWKASQRLRMLPQVLARPGQSAGSAAQTYSAVWQDLQPDGLIVLLGTNDYLGSTPLAEFRTAYQVIIGGRSWKRVVCVVPPPVAFDEIPNAAGTYLDEYRQGIREACSGWTVVETQESMPFGPRYFRNDVDFTAAGHRRLARLVFKAFQVAFSTPNPTLPTPLPLQRVVLVGDSIADSVCATSAKTTILAQWQALRPDLKISTYAKAGWAASQEGPWGVIDPTCVSSLWTSVIVFWLGMNDYQFQIPVSTFRDAYGGLLDDNSPNEYWSPRRYCLLPIWRAGGEDYITPLDSYRQVIREECDARGLPVLDPRDALSPGRYEDYCDVVHPNDAGNAVLAGWLARVIER